jgi:hypothetical protein
MWLAKRKDKPITFLRSALVQQETYRLGYFPLNAGNFETLFIEHLG